MKTKLYAFALAWFACLQALPPCLGQPERLAPLPYAKNQAVAVFHAGDEMYFRLGSQLWHTALSDGATRSIGLPQEESVRHWSFDGQQLYVFTATVSGQARLYRIEAGVIQSGLPVEGQITLVLEHAPGARLYWVSYHDNAGYRLNSIDATGQSPTLVASLGSNSWAARVEARIYFRNQAGRLACLDTGTNALNILSAVLPGAVTGHAGMGDAIVLKAGSQSVWRSDGTEQGTFEVMNGGDVATLIALPHVALIRTTRVGDQNCEVWTLARDARTPERLLVLRNFWSQIFTLRNRLFIAGQWPADGQYKLWETDGTAQGTRVAVPLEQAHHIVAFRIAAVVQNQWALARANNREGMPLAFTFDGDEVYPLTHWPGPASAALGEERSEYELIQYARSLGGMLYSPLMYGHIGVELWQIAPDGRTRLVADVQPGVRWSFPRPLALYQGYLYFLAESLQGAALYRIRLEHFAGQPPQAPASKYWAKSIMPVLDFAQLFMPSAGSCLTGDVLATQGGDVYVAGQRFYSNSLAFPGQEGPALPLFPYGTVHFLVRLDGRNGQVRWAREIAANLSEPILYREGLLAPAPEDGVYTANVFDAEERLSLSPRRVSGRRAYIARLDSTGAVRWHISGDLGSNGEILSILRGRNGNLYVFGLFSFYRGHLGDVAFTARTSPAIFAAMISPDGQILKARTFDLPVHWSSAGGNTVPLRQDASGRLYLVLNQIGYRASQSCDFQGMRMKLHCLSEDLEQMLWQQELRSTDLAYASALDISPAGYAHLIGRYRGEITHEGLSIHRLCSDMGTFMAIFHPDGRLTQLRHPVEGDIIIHDLQFDSADTYLIAGTERKPGSNRSFNGHYPGYADYYFPNGRLSSFVQRRQALGHQLLQERRFLKPAMEGFGQHLPRIARFPDGDLALYDQVDRGGIVDTFANIPLLFYQTQAIVTRFHLPVTPRPPDDAPQAALLSRLWPNPSDNEINLIFSPEIEGQTWQLEFRNALGQPVLQRFTGNSVTQNIDIRRLPAGVYSIYIRAGERERVVRFVKP